MDEGRKVAAALARPAYALYTRRLRRDVRAAAGPRHLAVILDGNRRWAAGEGLSEAGAGHRRGADKIEELLDWCAPLGIEEITLWALSNENLGRPGPQLTRSSRSSATSSTRSSSARCGRRPRCACA